MKTTYKVSLAIITCTLLAYTSADAQEFKTDKSIAQQLEEGNVPGLKFAPVTPAAQKAQKINDGKDRKYSVRDIEEVLFTGFTKRSSALAQPAAKSANSVAGPAKLASDSQAKKVEDKDKKVAAPILPPTQDQTGSKKKD